MPRTMVPPEISRSRSPENLREDLSAVAVACSPIREALTFDHRAATPETVGGKKLASLAVLFQIIPHSIRMSRLDAFVTVSRSTPSNTMSDGTAPESNPSASREPQLSRGRF